MRIYNSTKLVLNIVMFLNVGNNVRTFFYAILNLFSHGKNLHKYCTYLAPMFATFLLCIVNNPTLRNIRRHTQKGRVSTLIHPSSSYSCLTGKKNYICDECHFCLIIHRAGSVCRFAKLSVLLFLTHVAARCIFGTRGSVIRFLSGFSVTRNGRMGFVGSSGSCSESP